MSRYHVVCKTRYGEAFVFLYPEVEQEFYGRHFVLNPTASTQFYPGCVIAFNPFIGYQRHPLITTVSHTDSSFVAFGPGVKGSSFEFNADTFADKIMAVYDPLREGACDVSYLGQFARYISKMPEPGDLFKYLKDVQFRWVAPFLRGYIKELFLSIKSSEMSEDFRNMRELFSHNPENPPVVALQPKDIQSLLFKVADQNPDSFGLFFQTHLLTFCRCFVPSGISVPSVIYKVSDGKYKEVSL